RRVLGTADRLRWWGQLIRPGWWWVGIRVRGCKIMQARGCRKVLVLAGVVGCLIAAGIAAAGDSAGGEDVFSDRSHFFPHQNFAPRPARVVGVLAAETQEVTTAEGRRGPADAFGFGRGGGSYLWVYVLVPDKAFAAGPELAVSEKP